jgi:hypothetical protein
MRIPIAIAIALASAVTFSATAAIGAPAHATKGDATAVLEAFGSGGWAVLQHSKVAAGAPALGVPGPVAIRPFSGTPFDGAHYCALDWHAIAIADIEPGPHQVAAAALASIDYRFTLDAASLPVERTAVSRFLNPERFGLTEAFYSQWGRVMSPSDLAPGSHHLDVVETDNTGSIVYTDGITFYVDAAGTGACL